MIDINISDILNNKKYLCVYFVFLLFFIASFYHYDNFKDIHFDFIILLVMFIGGSSAIIYFSKTKNLHRTCFIVLLIFGLVMCLTTPSFIVCDEIEHYARSDLTAQGILFPEYINNEGYSVSSGFNHLLYHRGELINNHEIFNLDIGDDHSLFNGCFPQNPFFPYLLSGLGILISNLLNLNVMWSMYLGRFFNVLFYCAVCSFAVKKAPKYKLPIFIVSCIPLSVYQAASFSADGFLISVSLLAIAYFINIIKSDMISNYDLGIFFGLIFLVSLLKLPYVLLIFLIYLVKPDKFSSKRVYILSRLIPLLIIAVCAIYSLNASKLLQNTIRNEHFVRNNVNPKNQLKNMIDHPMDTLVLFSGIFNFTLELIGDLFRFSYEIWTYASPLLSSLYAIFFAFLCLTYENVKEFTRKHKLFITGILLVIYIGIIFIQYLSWAPFAYPKLDIVIGVYARYFIPLLAFLPLILNSERIRSLVPMKNYDLNMILASIVFLAGSVIFTLSTFY